MLISLGSAVVFALDATTLSAVGSILSGAAALIAATVALAGVYIRRRRKNARNVDTVDVDVPLGASTDETAHYLLGEIARMKAEMDAKKDKL